jgi:hypothetical protein
MEKDYTGVFALLCFVVVVLIIVAALYRKNIRQSDFESTFSEDHGNGEEE